MNNELLKDYLDYCEKQNRKKADMNYLVSDIKDTYFSSDRTWFYPLIIHNKYQDILTSLLKNDLEELYLPLFKHIPQPKIEDIKLKSIEMKYHGKLGNLLWVKYLIKQDGLEKPITRVFTETSSLKLLGTHINGPESELMDDFSVNDVIESKRNLCTDWAQILSKLNKGRTLGGKTYDEVYLERCKRELSGQYLAKIVEMTTALDNLKAERIDAINNFHTVFESQSEKFEKENRCPTLTEAKPTM